MTKRTLSVLLTGSMLAVMIALPAADAGAKKRKKKPKPPACAAYVPGELGTGKPSVTVTDAHTAEAPLEQKVTLAASTADIDQTLVSDAGIDVFNLQVDSAATSGLYATIEFPERNDIDLYLRWPDGSEAASSHGFNTLAEASAPEPVPFDPSNTRSNHAGETTPSSESLIGVITPDCGGYTMEVQNWLGDGGELTVKLWLGEGTTEPLPPGA